MALAALAAAGCSAEVTFHIENRGAVPVTVRLPEWTYRGGAEHSPLDGLIVLSPGETALLARSIDRLGREELEIGVVEAWTSSGDTVMRGEVVLIPARDDGCTIFVEPVLHQRLACHHVSEKSRATLVAYERETLWRNIQMPLALAATVLVTPLLGWRLRATDRDGPSSNRLIAFGLVATLLSVVALFAGFVGMGLLVDGFDVGPIAGPYAAAVLANALAPALLIRRLRGAVSAGLVTASVMGILYTALGVAGELVLALMVRPVSAEGLLAAGPVVLVASAFLGIPHFITLGSGALGRAS